MIMASKKKLIIFSSFEKRLLNFFLKMSTCIYSVILPKFIPVHRFNELKKENFKIKKFQTNNFNKNSRNEAFI